MSTSLEEGSKYFIDGIKVRNPELTNYIQYFITNDKFGNMNFSVKTNVERYVDDLALFTAVKAFKGFTVSGVEIPIPGSNSSVGLTGIGSVFMGMDFANNLKSESVGRAFMHTAANVATATLVAEALTVGTAYVANLAGMTTFAATILSNPIGWAVGAGIVGGIVAGWAYKNNFLGVKDIANEMGDNLEENLKDAGRAFDSGIKSIQHVFGW